MATVSTASTASTPTTASRKSNETLGKKLGKSFLQGGTIVALIALVLFFFAMRPDVFLGFLNVKNILFQVSILAIIAGAQTLTMVVGDFDLSVGATSSLAGAVTGALLMNGVMDMWPAIAVGLLVGIGIGLLNGLLIAYVNLSAFVATLAMMTSVVGLAFIVTDGTTIFKFPEEFNNLGQGKFLEIPLPVYIAVTITLILWAFLRFTTLGRAFYAVGGSTEVSRLSGVNVRRARLLAFTMAGGISALGGILLAARLGSASAVQGGDNMMYSVAAVFLGMTIIKSGMANIGGTMIGVGIIGVMSNGLNIIGVNSYIQQVVTGAIIILAVTLSALKNRER